MPCGRRQRDTAEMGARRRGRPFRAEQLGRLGHSGEAETAGLYLAVVTPTRALGRGPRALRGAACSLGRASLSS